MCSIGDDVDLADNFKFMEEKPLTKNLAGTKCLKCRVENALVLVQDKHPYCQACFLAGTVHKFRGLLGKHKIVRTGDRVLVCHRLGHASTALVHFLHMGLAAKTHKRIRFQPIFLYVERHWKLSVEERYDILRRVKEEADKFAFRVYFASLHRYIRDPTNLDDAICEDYDKVELSETDAYCIGSGEQKPSLSNQYEILDLHERNLVVSAARHLNCKVVFTPDLGVDIAASLLSVIALGRGAHAKCHSGFIDTSNENVTILRPLRNFTVKELAYYNVFNKLEPINVVHKSPRFGTTSIQGLMNRFVTDLQTNYPSTISTVVRTSDKLSVDKTVEKNNRRCAFCKAPIENECRSGSADAVGFSHRVSLSQGAKSLEEWNSVKQANGVDVVDYCYGCKKLQRFL